MARRNRMRPQPDSELTAAQAELLHRTSAESLYQAQMFTWQRLGSVGEPRTRAILTREVPTAEPPATPFNKHIYVGEGAGWLHLLLDGGGMVSGPAEFQAHLPCLVSMASPQLRLAMLGAGQKGENIGDDQLVLRGTALVYERLSKPDSSGTRTTFKRGAFTRCLSRKPLGDYHVLFNFRTDCVLGRVAAGTAIIFERGDALLYEVQPPDAPWSTDLLVSVGRRDISGSAASCVPTVWHYEYQNGERIKVVEHADLVMGVSVCSWSQFDEGLSVSKRTATASPSAAMNDADKIRGHGLGVQGAHV